MQNKQDHNSEKGVAGAAAVGAKGPGASQLTALPAHTAGSKTLQWVILASFLGVSLGIPLWQTLKEGVVDHEAPHLFRLFTRLPTKANLHAWDQSARDRNIFAKFIRPKILQWQYDYLGDLGVKAVAGQADWLFYKPDVQALVEPSWNTPRFYHDSFDTTLSTGQKVNQRNPMMAMAAFREALASRGIALVLIPVPGKPSLYPEKLTGKIYNGTAPLHDFIASLRSNGFQVCDILTPLEVAKKSHSEELYLRRDTHWTPVAIACIAPVIAQALRPFLPDSLPRKIYHSTTVSTPRQGDIVEMTQLPHRESIWQPQVVVAEQVQDSTTSEKYQDDPNSPVLWLGDSFSRIYQTDAPTSAGIISHVAQQLGIALTSLVNDGGASTSVRQQLLRKPQLLQGKKVVVWEFVERDIRFGKDGWQILPLPEAL